MLFRSGNKNHNEKHCFCEFIAYIYDDLIVIVAVLKI